MCMSTDSSFVLLVGFFSWFSLLKPCAIARSRDVAVTASALNKNGTQSSTEATNRIQI